MYDKFFTDMFSEDDADIIVIGVNRGENGKEYLKEIRKQSWFVEIFDIYKKKNLFDKKIADVGDVKDYKMLESELQDVFSKGKIPVIITKGDIASYYACRNTGIKNMKVISFDAHTDLLDEYTDEKIFWIDGTEDKKVNSATWLKRTSELVGTNNICIVGLRSVDEDLYKFMTDNKITYITPKDVKRNPALVREIISRFTKESKVWLNVDVDFFDPSIAPSVDYPEPEGLTFEEFQEIVAAMKGKIAGITLCGGNPSNNHVTEFITVRALFELLSKI